MGELPFPAAGRATFQGNLYGFRNGHGDIAALYKNLFFIGSLRHHAHIAIVLIDLKDYWQHDQPRVPSVHRITKTFTSINKPSEIDSNEFQYYENEIRIPNN